MRLNNYDNFITESSLIRILNEGIVKASGDLIDRLKSISKQSEIANKLYRGFEKEYWVYNNHQNYIDVTDKEDLVSFIDNNKVSGDDPYSAKGRSTIKVGRLVNALINNKDIKPYFFGDYTPTTKEVEDFVNLYKSAKVITENKFRIVEGEDISKWYSHINYYSQSGQLGNSCMKSADPSFFDIYVLNPDVCKLLIYVNEYNKLLGRALLWKLEESPNEAKYFMDRIYTNRDSDIPRFKNYATKEGWLRKYRDGYDPEEGVLFMSGSTPVIGKISVQLKNCSVDDYPFVDTLSFFNKRRKILSNVGSKNSRVLHDTCGGDNGKCDSCNGTGFEMRWSNDKERDVKSKCNECTGILKSVIRQIRDEGMYGDFINYLPK